MGFIAPDLGRGAGTVQLRLPPPLPHLHPERAGKAVPRRVGAGAEGRERPRVPGKSEPHGPREEGRQEGGARCGEETERRPARSGCRAAGDPAPVTHPRAKAKEGVPRARRRQNLLRGPPPRGSRGRRPGLPAGSAGPGAPGREDGAGETQRETLVPGRRGPRARPAPAAPTARPGLGAANTHHHGCSETRASAGAHRTAGRREPAAAAAAGGRGGAGGGASEQLRPAPPLPPRRGGPGSESAEEGVSALRPRS